MISQNLTLPAGYILRGPERTYKIIKVLGRGGFGITYLATAPIRVGNINIEGKFAIKEHFVSSMCSREGATHTVEFSQPVAAEVDRLRKAFVKEASRIQNLGIDHPNIVKINEVFEVNNTAYYVMEYLGDLHLQDFIKANGPLTVDALEHYVRPVIEAVAQLHAANIAHYDIKPENIMMAPLEGNDNRAVLIDFGLAKHYDANGGETSTVGAAGYSPGFAPAEQYGGVKEYSPTMDVYALGATVYFCLTGKTPADAFRVKASEIERELNAIAGPRIASAVAHAMTMAADDRTPDAGALLAEMGWGDLSSTTVPIGGNAPQQPPAEKPVTPYQQPVGYQQPGYQQPAYQQPAAYQQPGYQQPAGYQQPGYQQPAGYQQPGYQQTVYMAGGPGAPQGPRVVVDGPQQSGHGSKKALWITLGIVGGILLTVLIIVWLASLDDSSDDSYYYNDYNSEEAVEVVEEDSMAVEVPVEEMIWIESEDDWVIPYQERFYVDDQGYNHDGYYDSDGNWVETKVYKAQ